MTRKYFAAPVAPMRVLHAVRAAIGVLLWIFAADSLAFAEAPPDIQAAAANSAIPAAPSHPDPVWQSENLFGDPLGVRSALHDAGVGIDLTLTTDLLRSSTGGYERSTDFAGLGALTLSLDTEAAFGWPGGRLNASLFGIWGSSLTIDGIGSLATASTIEAERSLRLFELWYEQAFWGGRASLRLGQLAVDEEFLITSYGQIFVNGNFGWPTLAGIDLPSGGPSYPFAAPGVRLKLAPAPGAALLLGLFSGDPAPAGFGDSQQTNRNGLNFLFDRSAFAIVEAQYSLDLGGAASGLPGTYKLGAWWNGNVFLDQHLDANGLSITDINSTGFPASRRGDWSVYGVIDQALWHPRASAARGLGGFVRIMAAPDDRNTVSAQVDGGLSYRGLLPGRPDDRFAFGAGWFKISEAARALDRDIVALGLNRPVRSAEVLLEATYQAQILPGWQIQPDLQLTIRPGGGVPSPDRLSRDLGDVLVFGIRSTITF